MDTVLVCERCRKEYAYHEEQEGCWHVWIAVPALLAYIQQAITSPTVSKENDISDEE
jgi:hypothetical protein